MDYQSAVLVNYREKNFLKCLSLIEDCPIEKVRISSHYKVLKATCLVRLGIEIETAHILLDEVLEVESSNEFAHYCKGLLYHHEKKMMEAVESFDKAINLDKLGSMKKAKELREQAMKQMKQFEENKDQVKDVNENEGKVDEEMKKIIEKDEEKIAEIEQIESNTGDIQKKSDTMCLICKRTFSSNHSLKRHMLTHSAKRFRCHICSSR